MTVERVRVGDVLRLERRRVAVEPQEEYVEIGVRSFGRGIFHKVPVDGASLGNKRVFRIEPEDLVISNVFAWEGAIAAASHAEAGTIGSHRFMTFVPTDDRIEIGWASWFFRSELGLELIRRASPGSAGRNRTLAIERFEALKIPLPPMDEQRRVAERLNDTEAACADFNTMRAANVKTVDALQTAILLRAGENSDLIPIGEIARQVRRPVAVMPHEDYRLVGCRWYGDGLFERERKAGVDIGTTTLFELRAGDFVYNRLFAWKGSFGIVSPDLAGATVSGEFPTFELDTARVAPHYFLATTLMPSFLDQVAARSSGSTPTSRNRLKEAQFQEIEIAIPPIAVQEKVGDGLRQLQRLASVRVRQSALVGALVPAALNEAIAGLS